MLNETDFHSVQNSYKRCTKNDYFHQAFFDTLTKSSRFTNRILSKAPIPNKEHILSKDLLHMFIERIPAPDTLHALKELKTIYDKENHDFNKDFYPFWVHSLMKTVKRFDTEISPDLEDKWYQLIEYRIDVLMRH